MAEKYQNIYRIASARLQTWDYGWNAAYFVLFAPKTGNITYGKMHLSETGNIAQKFWMEIPNHFPFARLGEFIIMPDHMHGIIIIDKFDDRIRQSRRRGRKNSIFRKSQTPKIQIRREK